MKQVQQMMSRWIKGFVATASMFVFSVSLASGNDVTTAPNTGTPYSYSNPNSNSTAPSYNDVGRPIDEETQSLMLNNQALGLAGPLTVSTGYSANYGYELNASFSHMLGFYDAVSLLGAYAPQENRVDITWAHAWTENQRTKLSVERLEEAMDFDYDSGSVTKWVPQYAYGAGYQYLFNKNWLKNVELSGYYAKAQSQDLSTIQFTNENGTFDNYRHIAGATSKGSQATLNVAPWATGLVGLGLNYDSVNYDTKYDDTDAEDAKGFGFTLSLEQLLSKHVKFNLEGSQREVYDDYVAGVSFLTPSNLEVGVNGERTLGANGSASDSRFNLNLAYFFDDKNRYENGYSLENASQSDLATWASKSVAYMDEVLAAADQQTIQVNNSLESNNPTLQSGDAAPVLTLTEGEINHVDISAYIASANLTDSQKQATPTIKGGPSDVEFVYDNTAESLVTTTEVPESAVGKETAPLVLVFPTENTLRDATTNTNSLEFKVAVSASGTAPTLNPSFNSNQTPVMGVVYTQVFKYQNSSNTTDPLAMFINTNTSFSKLFMLTSPTKYPVISGDTNKCYSAPYNDQEQTLTVTSIASDVCPGNATITVKTTNTFQSSPVQTINFTALPAGTPIVTGGPITTPAIVEDQVYSPGHTFTTAEVSPGKNETFNTNNTQTYVKVFDAGTAGTTCTDVTSVAGWGLGYTNGNTQTILQSTGALPESLTGHQLKIYLHVTNNAAAVADNGTTSNCGGTPFTATVEGAPKVPANINLGTATVDTSYSYDFITQGGVTTGSSNLSGTSSYTMDVVNTDNSETPVTSAELGLAVNIGPTTVTMTGIPEAAYAGDTIHVYLNLVNTQGYTGNNDTAPATLLISTNPAQLPAVGGGSALTSVNEGQSYSSDVLSGTTAGTGREYSNVNTADATGTYVKVAEANGNDVTALANVNLSANGSVLTLQSNGGAVDSSLHGLYNVYVHVTNDAKATATNCSSVDCSTLTGGNPYTVFVNTPPVIVPSANISTDNTGPATIGVAYSYDFSTQGTLTLGASASGATQLSTSTLTMTLADGTPVNPSDLGLTPTYSATDVVLAGTPIAGKAGTYKVFLTVTDASGFVVNNNAAPATLTIAAPTPTVIAGTMPGVNLGESYSHTFANAGSGGASGPVVSAGAGEFFDEDATTFTVTGLSGGNVTSQFHLVYSSNASVQQGNTASHGHNVVSLVSNGALQSADALTVSFHVVNADAKNVDGTPGTIAVGSVTGYLNCPTGDQVFNRPTTPVNVNLYDAPSGGNPIATVPFVGSGKNSGPIQLNAASLSNGVLTCQYGVMGVAGSNEYKTTASVPVSATGSTSDWGGGNCSVDSRANPSVADQSCQITYSYEG